jgi:ABC-type glutathione transport system ATPase component
MSSSQASRGDLLLVVNDLRVGKQRKGVTVPIVEQASFSVAAGETVALLGGTGSGKTLTARSIMGVLPPGITRLGGEMLFEGRDLAAVSPNEMRLLRGRKIAYVPQNASAALHPQRRVGAQMRTVMRDLELTSDRRKAKSLALTALESVRIQDPERVYLAYSHELSGGMAQRVAIAISLLARPRLLIADEPTTGLDATVQAQVMRLIEERAADLGASTLIVTHDLGVVAQYCERAVILENGRVTEETTIDGLFAGARSEYGRRLVASARHATQTRLVSAAR